MTIQANFPAIRPSLLLDFANGKTLDPRITFSRPTTATYYNGVTSAVAEQNLLTYSQDFSQSTWGKYSGTITANSTTAPDGTTTASTYTGDGASATHAFGEASGAVSNAIKTFSIYAKAGTNNFVQLYCDVDSGAYANFNLSLGTVGTVGGTATASIVSVGSGWYRCVVVMPSAATLCRVNLITSATAAKAETNTLSTTIYVWGAQLEQRSAVTAYTATTTAAKTNYIPVLQTAASGSARFDHNPTTGESLGLLIEEQRTNLVTYSSTADTSWSPYNSSRTSNIAIAPDGTQTASKMVEDTTNTQHGLNKSITYATGSLTRSIYAKAGERSWLNINFYDGSTSYNTWFDLTNGVVGTNASGNTSSITAVGNGWYRCTITRTATGTSGYFQLNLALADNGTSYTGNGYSGLYIWGGQVEQAAFATSYIPTVASQVTRSADSATMTGTNFSSWYNNAEGTLYAEAFSTNNILNSSDGIAKGIINISDGTNNNNFTLAYQGTRYFVNANNVTIILNTVGTFTANASFKFVGSYTSGSNYSFARDGVLGTSVTSGLVPIVNQLNIGRGLPALGIFSGTIKKFAYYPIRVTNAQLQGLTG